MIAIVRTQVRLARPAGTRPISWSGAGRREDGALEVRLPLGLEAPERETKAVLGDERLAE